MRVWGSINETSSAYKDQDHRPPQTVYNEPLKPEIDDQI